MNKNYIYAILAFFAFAVVGCEDLDTLPEGSVVTSSQKEEVVANDATKASASVNSIFAQFKEYEPNYTALGNVARHNDYGYPSIMMFGDHNGMDLVSADVGYNWNGNNLDYSDRIYTSRECQIQWNDLYSYIATCNTIISSISSDTEDGTSQFYLAQAVSVRAFSYFILAQLYQFTYVGHEDDACVPIITDENSDDAALNGAARNTVQEVYDQVNTDIDLAISLLEASEDNGVTRDDRRYVSLAVAYGIRARVNLTMQNWSDAASDAEAAIAASDATPASISDVSVPYFWEATEGDWMWGIVVSETDDIVSSGIVNWISHMGSLNYGYANYSQGKQINKALYNSIPSTDVRKGWWLDENFESPNLDDEQLEFMASYYDIYTQCKFAPYENEVGTATPANDMPLMRIEEMYLIKAEALAMSGSTGEAVTTLESFVQTYRDPEYTCDATSASDIQEEVYFQRRIELWGEGLNWYDIMRLEKDVDRRGGGFPNASMVYNIEAGSDILLWRIPEAEIEANPAISTADNNPSASTPTAVDDID
jgi:hypothetical protein